MAIREKSHRDTGRPVIDLTGPDGNSFALLGFVGTLGKQLSFTERKIEAIRAEMLATGISASTSIWRGDTVPNPHSVLYKSLRKALLKANAMSYAKALLAVDVLEAMHDAFSAIVEDDRVIWENDAEVERVRKIFDRSLQVLYGNKKEDTCRT
jgi:hypothetical protein